MFHHYSLIKKKLAAFSLFFTGLGLMIILCGCPYHSPHRLDSTPQISLDESYIGNWEGYITDETYGKRTEFKLIMSRKNEFEYNMNFVGLFGRVSKKNIPQVDTVKSTAFISLVNDRKFLNITMDSRVYLAEVTYRNDELTILPLAEEFTSFIIKTDTQLRNVLEYHLKTRLHPSFDESFCMRNMKREPFIP